MVRATIMIDCGRHSGLGRVRRTLTLLDAFKAQGVTARIFLSDEDGADMVASHSYTYEIGEPTDIGDDILIIDTCTLSSARITELCAQARVSCVIDDLGERPVICDYVINPNLYASGVDYSAYKARHVFHGPAHSLLASEFFENSASEKDREGIVVSFGGTDNGALAAAVAAQLASKTKEPIFVPLPGYLDPADTLLELAARVPSVKPLSDPDMPALLGKARVYVGAAGATVLEALASGCAVCVAATQKDQFRNIEFLPSIGVPALASFHPDAMATMAEQMLEAEKPSMLFNIHASKDIATTALDAYHQAA